MSKIKLFFIYCLFLTLLIFVFEICLPTIFENLQGKFFGQIFSHPPPSDVDFTCNRCEINVTYNFKKNLLVAEP